MPHKIRQARCGADQRIAVGSVGDRPVDDAGDADRAQDRHAPARILDIALQPVQLIAPELEREIFRHAVEPMPVRPIHRGRAGGRRVPGAGSSCSGSRRSGSFLRGATTPESVRSRGLVRHRDRGHVATDHRTDFGRAIAGSVDHDLGSACRHAVLSTTHSPLSRRRPVTGQNRSHARRGRARPWRTLA